MEEAMDVLVKVVQPPQPRARRAFVPWQIVSPLTDLQRW